MKKQKPSVYAKKSGFETVTTRTMENLKDVLRDNGVYKTLKRGKAIKDDTK